MEKSLIIIIIIIVVTTFVDKSDVAEGLLRKERK